MFVTRLKKLSTYAYTYIINSVSIWAKSYLTFFQFFSTMSENLLFNNIANTLYAVLNSVIGLWSLHFNLPLFLYIGHISSSFHCVGSSLSHIFKINLLIYCFELLPPCLISSDGILSEPEALLEFSLLIIVHIPLYFGDDTSYLSLKLSIIETDVCT